MDKLLNVNAVSAEDMQRLAALLANFHQQHHIKPQTGYHAEEDVHNFADLFDFEADLQAIQATDIHLMEHWKSSIPAFLQAHAPRQRARMQEGYWIEAHGDLHSRNIFLPEGETPVVFDCLEFNPALRIMDVLNELAFLCMDLEFYGHFDLADAFLQAYIQHWNCVEKEEDWLLFRYFKAYRANIRLKVSLLELRQHQNEALEKMALDYWRLLKIYLKKSL